MAVDRGILKQAFLRTLPVMTGYLVLGIAFGLLLKSASYQWWWALVISVFVYAGSMQFVLIGLLTQGSSLITVAITTLIVNSRHLFYGLSFIEKFKAMGKWAFYMIFSLTDETYGLLCSVGETGTQKERHRLMLYIAALNQCYWIAGSLAGSLLGSFLPFDSTGIEFAMTALFTVLCVEQWRGMHNHAPVYIGLGCAVLFLLLLGPGRFLLPTLLSSAVLLLAFRGLLEQNV